MRPVDGPAFEAVLALEVGEVIEVVRGQLGLGEGLRLEASMGSDEFLDDPEILLDIRGDPQIAPGREGALDLGQQWLAKHSALLVAALPPGVGKVDMDGPKARRGDEVGEKPFRVAGPDAHVAQTPLRHPLGRLRRIFLGKLHAQEVVTGPADRGVFQEKTLSRPDVHLDGVLVAKDERPGEAPFHARQVEGERSGIDLGRALRHRQEGLLDFRAARGI